MTYGGAPNPTVDVLSLRKKLFFASIVLALVIIASELVLRVWGAPVYSTDPTSNPLGITVDPPGRWFKPHDVLGFTHWPGQQRLTGYHQTWTQTHGEDCLRIMPEVRDADQQIWVFGCSYTHGFGVNDAEPYPRLLQDHLDRCQIVNFGTDAYGTVQMLLQYRLARTVRKKPNLVILGNIPGHCERDALIPSRRKLMSLCTGSQFNQWPYATLDRDRTIQIVRRHDLYTPIPGADYSAILNLIDDARAAVQSPRAGGMDVSLAVIKQFFREVESDGIAFVFAALQRLDASAVVHPYLVQKGIPVIDASLDYANPENVMPEERDHPSALGHRRISEKLLEGLRQTYLRDRVRATRASDLSEAS